MDMYIYIARDVFGVEITFSLQLAGSLVDEGRDKVYFRVYKSTQSDCLHMVEKFRREETGDALEGHIENNTEKIFDSLLARDDDPLDPYHIRRKIEKKNMVNEVGNETIHAIKKSMINEGLREDLVLDVLVDVHIETRQRTSDPSFGFSEAYLLFYEIMVRWIVKDKMKNTGIPFAQAYKEATDKLEIEDFITIIG